MRYLTVWSKEKNFISAVIYVYNAEHRIERFLQTVMEVFEENFEHSEIICVDDCSEDDSVSCIRRTGALAKTTCVSVIHMSSFHGLELSMNAGMDLAIGDFVFEFDSTYMDYDREEIMKVYRRSLEGYDIVSASPDKKDRSTSRFFYRVFERFTDFQGRMRTESFRILSRRVINRVSSMNKTVPYRKAIYSSCGLKTASMIYSVTATDLHLQLDAKEKRYRIGLAADSLLLFTDVGYRFSITMTAGMMFTAILVLAYSVVVYLTSNPVAGWTTTILFLSVAFFGLFGILTVIIKYLQLIIDLIFRRKRYSFESVEKL